ncbi:EF-hand calcium-binding domain-containing protein 6-like isoform X2 [Lineus longissimus]|uniref:EF-hand calcium-binding domain-containing protein 6-like isoform X2 n=1 Tax=Lineus longissimus TaxID=88925 RepID=UPI00315CCFE7
MDFDRLNHDRARTAPGVSPSKSPRLPPAPLSRPGTSSSQLRPKNLPIIEHPLSRLGDRKSLNINGLASRLGHDDEFYFGGRGASSPELPPVGRRMYQSVDGLDWTLDSSRSERKFKKYDTIENQASSRYGPEMLEALIREKLIGGTHGLKHLFMTYDPSGEGIVTREALLRILSSMCGYITPEQLSKLLRNMGCQGAEKIPFERFINYFTHSGPSQHQWITPVVSMDLQTIGRPDASGRFQCQEDHYLSAGFSNNIIKQNLQSGTFDVHRLFPPSCFAPDGLILPPFLKEAIQKMGMRMTEEEFQKLWDRFDLNATGAISMQTFFKMVGLDPQGHSRTIHQRGRYKEVSLRRQRHQIPTAPPEEQAESETGDKVVENGVEDPGKASPDNAAPSPQKLVDEKEVAFERKKMAMKQKALSVKPKFECVMDMLHYRFEEVYMAMLKTFELFDEQKDGYLCRGDFRKVLREFGFPISAMDLEGFMAKMALRSVQGMVNYKNFLWKFQNRANTGLVNRVVSTEDHVFQKQTLPPMEENIPIDQLEARLVECFHKDFLKLLSHFRKADNYDLGVVKQYEFRNGVEKVLNLKMTDKQWHELLQAAKPDGDGLVNYNSFLEIFNLQPGTWNRKLENGYWLTKVECPVAPPELKRLKEAQEEFRKVQEDLERKKEQENNILEERMTDANAEGGEAGQKRKQPVRPLEELYNILEDVFRDRFHSIDKAFKRLDRRYTGRIDKEQFRKILLECQVDLSQDEMEEIWVSLKLAKDGMYSYRTLIYQFMTKAKQRGPPPIKGKLPMESTKEVIEDMKKKTIEKKEEEMKAAEDAKNEKEVQQPQKKTDPVLEKIRKDVVRNWDRLKAVFRLLDKDGYATIMQGDLDDIYKLLHLRVSTEDQEHINTHFCKRGRFHYIPFMQYYTDAPPAQAPMARRAHYTTYNKMSHKLEKKLESDRGIVWDIIQQIRQELLKEWKNVRRAFRKLDPSRHGYLDASDFKHVLSACKISVSDEDLFQIMCEFDTKMNGKISYEDFLAQILSTY